MSVTMVKVSDGSVQDVKGSGWNDGSGPLEFIGGMSLRKTERAIIRVAGPKVNDSPVRSVVVESAWGDYAGGRLVTADGCSYPHGPLGSFAEVRELWLRYVLRAGIYAGIARMR